MSKRRGPALTVAASCIGCEHIGEFHHTEQGDTGVIVTCMHGGRSERVGDTMWRTPAWCPMLPEAKRRLALALSNEDVGV